MLANLFIDNLLKKAGITVDKAGEKFKVFFENPELAKLDVPDDLVIQTDANLISLTAAKDNYGPLKNHYTALALNGIDTNLEQLFDAYGISDDDKTELKLEKSTGKRVEKLMKKVEDLTNKKATADKPDLKKINENIADLNRQILAERQKGETAIASAQLEIKKFKLDAILERELGKHKSVFDESLSPELRMITLRTAIESALQKKGAKRDFDESGNLILLKASDGTKYFGESNEPVDFPKFVEQALSSEKLLVVNKPQDKNNPPVPPNGGNPGSKQLNGGGGAAEKVVVGQNSTFQELMNGAQKDFKNNGQFTNA